MKTFSTIAIATLLTGCAVGPDYVEPDQVAPGTYSSVSPTAIRADSETFWHGFNDPVLQRLIDSTLSENYSLQAIVARHRGAGALLRQTRRDQWPSLTAFAGASDEKLADIETQTGTPDELEVYEVGAALQWEIDLFGRLARATQASYASFEASGADLQAAQVALVGQLAASYFELRGLQEQLQVAEQNVALQQSSLEIVSSRLEAGRGTTFDVLRARAQLDTTRAIVPELRAAIKANMHRIAVLTGSTPGSLNEELSHAVNLPESLPGIAPETPGEVLRRRPDIRAAERRVAAASARIGVATADLFPRFTLAGLTGTLASSGSDLFSDGSEYRRIAFGVDWTFLDMARVRARVDAADAEAEAALADYRESVLRALEETETWLTRYHHAGTRVRLLSGAEQAAVQAVAQARVRYEQGYIDYFELLTAELELTRARDSLVRSETDRVLAMVNVYRSLAGAPEFSEQSLATSSFTAD